MLSCRPVEEPSASSEGPATGRAVWIPPPRRARQGLGHGTRGALQAADPRLLLEEAAAARAPLRTPGASSLSGRSAALQKVPCHRRARHPLLLPPRQTSRLTLALSGVAGEDAMGRPDSDPGLRAASGSAGVCASEEAADAGPGLGLGVRLGSGLLPGLPSERAKLLGPGEGDPSSLELLLHTVSTPSSAESIVTLEHGVLIGHRRRMAALVFCARPRGPRHAPSLHRGVDTSRHLPDDLLGVRLRQLGWVRALSKGMVRPLLR